MRMWLRRVELDAMLTRELQKIAGCDGSTLTAGAQITVWAAAGFEDTMLGWNPKPEVVHGNETAVQPGVQA